MADVKIKRALIAVYDKTGVAEFAKALVEEFGVEIISTGGTARHLKEAGVPVTMVEQVTGFPEMLDGRVKTLHPKIHAAILADRDNPEHMRQLAQQGIEPIDMVVVNLYPFEETIAKPGCTFAEAIEMIDIGGPCLLRAAAKNHHGVVPVVDSADYGVIVSILRAQSGLTRRFAQERAHKVYELTRSYDLSIAAYLWRLYGTGPSPEPNVPRTSGIASLMVGCLEELAELSYGENPHQFAGLFDADSLRPRGSDVKGPRLRGAALAAASAMSFNNFADASAALELCAELTRASPNLWHRHLTGGGVAPASSRCESAALASSRWKPVGEERQTRRNLPHIQKPDRSYFVTFRLRQGELPPEARDKVLSACRFWHEKKMTLHAVVVMPDHVHLLLTPYLYPSGEMVPLGELTHSIKSYSANEVDRLLGRPGPLWLDESWDRLIRHQKEFAETWEYIETNPERKGLGPGYAWFWKSDTGFEEGGLLEIPTSGKRGASIPADHRQDACDTRHRLEAGATPAGATPAGAAWLGGGSPSVVCFIKHTNACGAAVEAEPIEAYRKAYLGDPNAAMGGVLAVNFEVTVSFAEAVMETYQRWGKAARAGGFFVEVWLAPSFDDEAVRIIRGEKEDAPKKDWGKRVRLLSVGDMSRPPDPDAMVYRTISGGMLVQTSDNVGLNEDQWKVVTKRRPTETEMADLRLAWLVCKHTKSNAITICKDGMLIGNGAGQMSRVMSCRIATWLAKENGHADALKGAVAASDAFFPFRDGPDILMDAGVAAIIQPGGSKRDEDTIAACDTHNVAMIFTGTRHFRH